MYSSRSEAMNLINDIVTSVNSNKINEIANKCNALVKHLFSHQYLLFTDLNYYFKTSSILPAVISILQKVPDSSQRDVLRFIHLLLQVNNSLCTEARHSNVLHLYLLRNLDQQECWQNRVKYKHHINIASQILMDRGDSEDVLFNTPSVRKLSRQIIETLIAKNAIENADALSCIIFYACSMCTNTFDRIQKFPEDTWIAEKILTKEVSGKTLDILREYIQDFKFFYESENDPDRKEFILYKPKSEFSFQQICKILMFYSVQNETLIMNLYQAGLFILINNFLSIKTMPEQLLIFGVNMLKLAVHDDGVFNGVKTELLESLSGKLKSILKRNNISEESKVNIQEVLKVYGIYCSESFEIPSGNIIRNTVKNEDALLDSSRFENWDSSGVQKWLIKNKLDPLQETFLHLTGNGLEQLQSLLKNNDKMTFVVFLVEKVNVRFDLALELISALEKI